MVRTQIQLQERQSQALKQAAKAAGISVAEFIRRSVDTALREQAAAEDGETARRRALGVIGAFDSGTGDLAAAHDRYLDQAYAGDE